MTKEQKELYKDWKKLVNMSAKDLEKFADSDYGKKAGLSRREASKKGIRSGRTSARAIIRMKNRPVKEWNKNDWEWAQAQVNFLNRTIPQGHDYENDKGEPTRHLLSLMIWGHDPYKK